MSKVEKHPCVGCGRKVRAGYDDIVRKDHAKTCPLIAEWDAEVDEIVRLRQELAVAKRVERKTIIEQVVSEANRLDKEAMADNKYPYWRGGAMKPKIYLEVANFIGGLQNE